MAPDSDNSKAAAAAKPAPPAGGSDASAADAAKNDETLPSQSNGSSPPPHRSGGGGGGKEKKKRAPIVYRWIGRGESQPDGAVRYDRLEMRVGGHAALIRVGDCALLCSGDVEEDQLYGIVGDGDGDGNASDSKDGGGGEGKRDDGEGGAVAGAGTGDNDGGGGAYGPKDANRQEEEDHYGPLDRDYDVAVNKLDPFVARVERMWEEPHDATGGSRAAARKRSRDEELLANYDERRSRMKIRARWFYKKEDIEGLASNFVGVSRDDLLQTMTPREIILGDQADDNEISTILGKCRVVRRRPLAKDADGRAVRPVDEAPTGAFTCRYSLALHPPARAGAAGSVAFSPYDGIDEGMDGGDDTGSSVGGSPRPQPPPDDHQPANKRRRLESDGGRPSSSSAKKQSAAADAGASDAGSGRGGRRASEGGATSGKNDSNSSSTSSSDDEDASDGGSAGKSDDAKRAPTSEGSQLHGSIMVGPDHQAAIPPLDKELAQRSRDPKLLWEPNSISDEGVDDYLGKAASVLKSHLEKNGMDIAETPLYDFLEKEEESAVTAEGDKEPAGSATPRKRKPRVVFRECDIDSLLANLHDCNYDVQAALEAISKSPETYLTIWTKREKESFNSGFRRYYGGLRTISKGIGKSKAFKDVVDYHYRFKIPEQFCKYKDKKREQARRIMESVEKQRLHAAMIEDGEDVSGMKGGMSGGAITPSSGKKTRNLSKTGGGTPHSIGKAERRRILARELLSVIRDTIGNDDYLKICRLLKSHQNRTRVDPSRKSSIPNLKERASDLLGDHPELLDRFIEFLPKKHRN